MDPDDQRVEETSLAAHAGALCWGLGQAGSSAADPAEVFDLGQSFSFSNLVSCFPVQLSVANNVVNNFTPKEPLSEIRASREFALSAESGDHKMVI
jgi:hypothetical protein